MYSQKRLDSERVEDRESSDGRRATGGGWRTQDGLGLGGHSGADGFFARCVVVQ